MAVAASVALAFRPSGDTRMCSARVSVAWAMRVSRADPRVSCGVRRAAPAHQTELGGAEQRNRPPGEAVRGTPAEERLQHGVTPPNSVPKGGGVTDRVQAHTSTRLLALKWDRTGSAATPIRGCSARYANESESGGRIQQSNRASGAAGKPTPSGGHSPRPFGPRGECSTKSCAAPTCFGTPMSPASGGAVSTAQRDVCRARPPWTPRQHRDSFGRQCLPCSCRS